MVVQYEIDILPPSSHLANQEGDSFSGNNTLPHCPVPCLMAYAALRARPGFIPDNTACPAVRILRAPFMSAFAS